MDLIITFPTVGSPVTVANLTTLIGGVAPVTVPVGAFTEATWAALSEEAVKLVPLALTLLEVEPNISVKGRFGTAP